MTDDDKIAIAARHGFDVHGGRAFAWPGQREVTANLFDALDEAFAAGVREGRGPAAVPVAWGVYDGNPSCECWVHITDHRDAAYDHIKAAASDDQLCVAARTWVVRPLYAEPKGLR